MLSSICVMDQTISTGAAANRRNSVISPQLQWYSNFYYWYWHTRLMKMKCSFRPTTKFQELLRNPGRIPQNRPRYSAIRRTRLCCFSLIRKLIADNCCKLGLLFRKFTVSPSLLFCFVEWTVYLVAFDYVSTRKSLGVN